MWKSKFKKLVIVASVLLLQPVLNPGSFALAKKKGPPKAYSFIAEGGKASQGECDGERKLPKMKRLKEYSHASSYMGSELQKPDIPGKPGEEMWKHFFRAKPACNAVLAKTPSSAAATAVKNGKTELPPDESDSEEDEDQEQGQGASQEQGDQAAKPDPE